MKEADTIRRKEFVRYFEKELRGDRQRLIENGVTKGRVTQYLDPSEPFGERAAIGIEDRMKLPRGAIFPSLLAGSVPPNTTINHYIPVVGCAKLGDDEAFFVELQYPIGVGDGYIEWPTRDQNAYALLCKGDSMTPRIKHGEFVIIEPGREIQNGDEVVVKDQKERVMVKQFMYKDATRLHFASINERYAPFAIAKDEILLMHFVAGIAKRTLWVQDKPL